MKKIGIVGGVGWQSTTEYYSGLCRRSEEFHLARNPHDVPTMPEISIESLDLGRPFLTSALMMMNSPGHNLTTITGALSSAWKRMEPTSR